MNARSSVTLGARLDIAAAPGLYSALWECREASVTIDASDVAHIGTHCLQVLLAATEYWSDKNELFQIVTPSEPFCRALGRMGASCLETAVVKDEI